MTAPRTVTGPLSWQQESLLTRQQQIMLERNSTSSCSVALSKRFLLPGHVSDSELEARLERMAEREPNLRAVGVSLGGVEYADATPMPITHVECDGEQDIRELVARSGSVTFGADGQSLWSVTVIHHRGAGGNKSRTAFVVFDHLITDRISMALMRRELCTGREASSRKGAGDYRRWVLEQREKFADNTLRGSSVADFWRGHFDDTSPKRPTPIESFVRRPRDQSTEEVWAVSEHVPVSPDHLASACRSARVTPLVLHVASVASAIARASDTTDVTLRLQTTGRGPRSAEIFGFLANTVPIRLRHPALASLDGALEAARTSWGSILAHQDTPLGFLEKLFEDDSMTGELAGRGQLVINYFPDTVDGITEDDYVDRVIDFPQKFLHLFIVPLSSGGIMFRLSCGGAELDIEDGRALLKHLKDQLLSTVEAAVGPRTDRKADGHSPVRPTLCCCQR